MDTSYQTLLQWLPEEYQAIIADITEQAQNHSIAARELLIKNVKAKGVTQQEMLNWIPALVSVTFMQHLGNEKIVTANEGDKDQLIELSKSAENEVNLFAAKYKDQRFEGITPVNFINSFDLLCNRALSEMHPETICFLLYPSFFDDEMIQEQVYTKGDWLLIKDFNPSAYERAVRTTACACDWDMKNPELKVIPVPVLETLLMLRMLTQHLYAVVNDIKKAASLNQPMGTIRALESIYDSTIQAIRSRFKYYRTITFDINESNVQQAMDELVASHVCVPIDLVDSCGPDMLCTPWQEE